MFQLFWGCSTYIDIVTLGHFIYKVIVVGGGGKSCAHWWRSSRAANTK